MAITLRSIKGSPLTYSELDGNFIYLSSSYALTGSNTFTGTQTINGNLIVNGTSSLGTVNITATVTGSTKFGNVITDTHQYTGSLFISGNLTPTGTLIGTASYALQSLSSSYSLTSISSSYALTSSYSLNVQNINTSSFCPNSATSSFAVTAINNFNGTQTVTNGDVIITSATYDHGLVLGPIDNIGGSGYPTQPATPSEGFMKLGLNGSTYYMYAYLGGQWRSASFS
jgi:hypothetical protein